jgi:hypothetical protein
MVPFQNQVPEARLTAVAALLIAVANKVRVVLLLLLCHHFEARHELF